MRTHLGCTGRVELGELSPEAGRILSGVEAVWLEFAPETSSLVVRHVQPDNTPALREIAGELVEFLSGVPEAEKSQIPGGALYYLDEETGQYVRLKVSGGGVVTVAWAQPDYAHASWEPFHGQRVGLVFDAYQRLNGTVRLQARADFAEELRSAVDRFGGLYPQGEFAARTTEGRFEFQCRDLNCSMIPLLRLLQARAEPPESLEGEIDVSSFRAGDVGDYGRFKIRGGEIWLVRPSLWKDAPETPVLSSRECKAAA